MATTTIGTPTLGAHNYPTTYSGNGWEVYSLPSGSQPFGIALTDKGYAVDTLRAVLIRVPLIQAPTSTSTATRTITPTSTNTATSTATGTSTWTVSPSKTATASATPTPSNPQHYIYLPITIRNQAQGLVGAQSPSLVQSLLQQWTRFWDRLFSPTR